MMNSKSGLNPIMVRPVSPMSGGKGVPAIAPNTTTSDPKVTQPGQIRFSGTERSFPKK